MMTFSNPLPRRWTLIMLFIATVVFMIDMTVRYNQSNGHIMYKMMRWQPQRSRNYSINSNATVHDEARTKEIATTVASEAEPRRDEAKILLMNKIHSMRGQKMKPVTKFKNTTQALKTTTTTIATTTTPTTTTATTASKIPGLISMDRDVSLPPEVPIRPDSKEPILQYSQQRDYKELIAHNDKCGRGNSVDLKLDKFDYENDVFLLVVIKTACALKPRRDAIRSTWGDEAWSKTNLGVNIRRVFLLGDCVNDNLRAQVQEEDKLHGDILQWEFFDSFRNLTLKDCVFLQWFSRNCRNVPYIFKGDDDVFVNMKNIVQYLKELPFDKRENLFVGSVLDGSPRILDPKWKYYVSYNLYPEKLYPAYVSGGGFLMSGHIAAKLFQASLLSRIIPIDDAFLGILLKQIGVRPQNDRGFKSWGLKKYDICRLAKIKTFHKMLPDKLIKAWHELLNLDVSTCGKESDDVFKTQT